jgi:GGDEF domain-containing protein
VAVDAMGEAASMELLVRADRAMYQAKHVRRGDVVLDWQDGQGTLTESG